MLRVLGGILLVGASSLIGFCLHRRLALRVRLLGELENAFSMLETEIVFLQTPLLQAVGSVAVAANNSVFRNFEAALADGLTPVAAMRQSLLKSGTCLTTADGDVLVYASEILGKSDAPMQSDYIQSVKKRLSEQRKQAVHTLQTTGRLYLSAGVLGGLLAVLLLL